VRGDEEEEGHNGAAHREELVSDGEDKKNE
jgi:hypothetical protein